MKTDYMLHEERYRQLLSSGRQGWEDNEQHARSLDLLARIMTWSEVPQGGRALELGCGDGRKSLWLARRGWAVSGVDIAPTAIEWARRKAGAAELQVDFRVGSVLDLADFADGELDLVIDGHCAHCIVGADRAALLGATRRVLRSSGVFVLITMCGEPPATVADQFDPGTRCLVRNGIATRHVGTRESLLGELEAAGFHVVRSEIIPRRDADDCAELVAVAR
ncbi:MAG: class I SAM-dependent methyltransferase [Acidobacteriota bacterium]